jgi:hypothetical protein
MGGDPHITAREEHPMRSARLTPVPAAARGRDRFPSPLDPLQRAFTLLTTGPDPLALDGRRVPGLPDRVIPLDRLKRVLLARATTQAARDAAWRALVLAARGGKPAWVVGACGVALPGLRRAAARVAAGYRGDTTDLDAEILAAYLAALHTIDIDQPGIANRLMWTARRAGWRARWTAERLILCEVSQPVSAAPPLPWGHPDLVLADAVGKGVISYVAAELIGATRLEHLTLAQAADRLGIGVQAATKLRQRAEARLARKITQGYVEASLSATHALAGIGAWEQNPHTPAQHPARVPGQSPQPAGTGNGHTPPGKAEDPGPARPACPPGAPHPSRTPGRGDRTGPATPREGAA